MNPRLVLLALLAPAALAADWPAFRGPDRTNRSPDTQLLNAWDKDGPAVVWKAEGVGTGFSSVAVAGDRVFTMGNSANKARLFALDRKTGKNLWEAELGGTGGGGGYPGTRCTPAVADGLVYGLSSVGDLLCVEADSGKERWRKNFRAKEYQGRSGGWEYSESPLIDGDRLVCVPGGKVATMLVLDRKTGDEVWKASLGDTAGYASVVVSNACGIKQYVTLTANATIGVDAATGKELWRYKKFAGNTANIPTPIVLGDQIFTAAGYGRGAALLTLTKDGGGIAVKEEWFVSGLNNKHGGLVVVGDFVFGDTDDQGNPYCAEWKTGKVKWKRNENKNRGKGGGSASLTYADGHLYVRYSNGVVSLVPAVGTGYSEASSFKVANADRNAWAHPVVIDGRLYVREKDLVWCYDVKGK